MRGTAPGKITLSTFIACLGMGLSAGCDPDSPLARPFLLPLASIDWQQRADLPNFSVSFDTSGSVNNPGRVTQINWVFGDGGGFVAGGLQIDHRYESAGPFTVTAYVFDADGFVDSLSAVVRITVPMRASDPAPATGSDTVRTDSTLTWTPGNGATMSILYLGTDAALVSQADPSTFEGEFAQATFAPADLSGGSAFFWRVDSVTAAGTVPGALWSFETAPLPGAITSPSPTDGAATIALDVILSWTAGLDAESNDVYFGTDSQAVADATTTSPEFQGNQAETEFLPADALERLTDYFWRVDQLGAGGTRKGTVLTFQTADLPGQITGPSPADGATDVRLDDMLSWTAGDTATSHDVYLGTTFDAVDQADVASPQFRDNQEGTTFEPTLAPNLTFFWRIDEHGPGGMTKGDVLEFTTAEAPTQAADLTPVDGDIEISVIPTLTWTAGDNTEEHLVFFGDDQQDVAAAGSNDETGILVATLDLAVTSYDPGAAQPLDQNTDYFWRIDERGPGGVTRGEMMSFTTRNPIRAGDPSPAIDDEDVALDATLSWTPGDQGGPPLSHDVYLGKDEHAITNATTASAVFMGNFPAATLAYAPISDLDMNTEYSWRIDERYDPNHPGVETEVAGGKVWQFTTVQNAPEKAEDPVPVHGATDVDLDTDLSWTAGAGAESHDVYFGDDLTEVTNAGPSTAGVFLGNFQAAAFALPELDPGMEHFWRIDEVNATGTTTGDVWRFTTLDVPGPITDPTPVDAAVDQSVRVQLAWTAGDGADSHDIYFGDDLTEVTNAVRSSAIFQGNQTDETFDPGELMPSTQFYWRIDEVNDAGTSTGTVLTFTTGTLPDKATGPGPADGAMDVAIDAVLSWTVGVGAGVITHDVYFGTSESVVAAATNAGAHGVFQGNQTPTTFDPGPLLPDVGYFWRIDEVGTGATRKGDVWRFRTARAPTQATLVAASGDGPADGAVGVALDPTLQWTPGTGPGTITHDVYFGTDQAEVQDATRADPEFKLTLGGNTFMPGAPVLLLPGTRYFWRIDTVDALGGTTEGEIWQFDTLP